MKTNTSKKTTAVQLRKAQKTYSQMSPQKSNPKTARPISTRHAMHVALKSSAARGAWKAPGPKKIAVSKIVRTEADRCRVELLEYASSTDQIHLLIRIRNRASLQKFLRSVSGRIAMQMTGSKKGRALKGNFWDHRPYTQVVTPE